MAIRQPSAALARAQSPHIRVRQVTVAYQTSGGPQDALRDINLDIERGSITALIGESGSGKSTLAMALLNSVTYPGSIRTGTVEYEGVGDILSLDKEALRKFRGEYAAMVFQASQDSMNPLKRVGAQLLDLARSHGRKDRRVILREAADLATRMSLPAERVLRSYQHELSGGMRQRANLLFALALSPQVLLLDEPTTALDVLSQSQVLDIIRSVHRERGLTTLLITHDMGVVAELAQRVIVLYAGRIVEDAPASELLRNPQHPYTKGLIRAIPRLTGSLDDAQPLAGSPPDLREIPAVGCVFRHRCPLRMEVCAEETPALREVQAGHYQACHLEVQADD